MNDARDLSRQLATRADVVAEYLLPEGVREGSSYRAGNTHGERGRSLTIELHGEKAGLWHDHATGDGGDLLDLVQRVQDCDFKTAAAWAERFLGIDPKPRMNGQHKPATKPQAAATYQWEYLDANGAVIGLVKRFDGPDGKAVKPYFNDGLRTGIPARWKGCTPLYGDRPADGFICIAEGEKAAQALRYAGVPACTSQGGSKAAKRSDWTPAAEATLATIWRDNDEAGMAYAEDVAGELRRINPDIDVRVFVCEDMEAGADAVDWIRARVPGWDGYRPDDRLARLGEQLRAILEDAPPMPAPPAEGGIDELSRMFQVTPEDLKDIREGRFIIPGVMPEGHLIAFAGLPGAGKTTVAEHMAAEAAQDGQRRVIYINADISSSAAPEAAARAARGGYELWIPDLKVGLSMQDVVQGLAALANGDGDLAGLFIIIDTLKKATPVINKAQAADVYKMLRKLTARGATVLCLAHCNKYPDAKGWPVYEGTGDLRSDFDELLLLHAHKGDYGEVTVSLYGPDQGCEWAKVRCVLEPCSWRIDVEHGRTVEPAGEWKDTVTLSRDKHQARQTADVIRDVHRLLLREGTMNKTAVLERMQPMHGERIVRRVLEAQAGKYWTTEAGDHNAKLFTAMPGVELPKPRAVDWGKS